MKDNHDENLSHDHQDDFTPLTFDDDAIKKFDPHHLQNFYSATYYRPKLKRDVSKRNFEMLKENEILFSFLAYHLGKEKKKSGMHLIFISGIVSL